LIVCDSEEVIWFHSTLASKINCKGNNKCYYSTISLKQSGFYYCYGRYSQDTWNKKKGNNYFIAKSEVRVYGKEYHLLECNIFIMHIIIPP